jgi:hypothetical protein
MEAPHHPGRECGAFSFDRPATVKRFQADRRAVCLAKCGPVSSLTKDTAMTDESTGNVSHLLKLTDEEAVSLRRVAFGESGHTVPASS